MARFLGSARMHSTRYGVPNRVVQGWWRKGAELTMQGGSAATAVDAEVRVVSDVDLHYREMVRSTPQHEKRERKELVC
jgi:hypothetical protein